MSSSGSYSHVSVKMRTFYVIFLPQSSVYFLSLQVMSMSILLCCILRYSIQSDSICSLPYPFLFYSSMFPPFLLLHVTFYLYVRSLVFLHVCSRKYDPPHYYLPPFLLLGCIFHHSFSSMSVPRFKIHHYLLMRSILLWDMYSRTPLLSLHVSSKSLCFISPLGYTLLHSLVFFTMSLPDRKLPQNIFHLSTFPQ